MMNGSERKNGISNLQSEIQTRYIKISQSNMQPNKDLYITKANFVEFKQKNIVDYYNFSKELGKGAYGVVYQGKEKDKNGSDRAVKKITKKTIKNPASLQNQIANLSELDHPGIIKLYETFEDQRYIFLVTGLCDGGELFEKLQKLGSFTQKMARSIFIQMLDALNYCHKQKIAHRDLKPENFLFLYKESLELKLIDFGLSFKWKNDMRAELIEKKDTKLVGTSYYIAPEIIAGTYDHRCDIWSLGVILYILVSAVPPFDGQNDREIIGSVKKGVYDLGIDQMKVVSKECKDLISKILQPEDKRLTISQIYQHPWIKAEAPATPLKLNFKKLREFTKYNKLQKIAANFIASKLSEKQVSELSAIFRQIDINHDGVISIEELKLALEKQKQVKSYQELRDVMDAIDTDKNGQINYTEFIASYADDKEMFKKDNVLSLFQAIDKDGNGTVDKHELRDLLQKNNLTQVNGRQIDEIMEICDKNNDGLIDLQEFAQALRR